MLQCGQALQHGKWARTEGQGHRAVRDIVLREIHSKPGACVAHRAAAPEHDVAHLLPKRGLHIHAFHWRGADAARTGAVEQGVLDEQVHRAVDGHALASVAGEHAVADCGVIGLRVLPLLLAAVARRLARATLAAADDDAVCTAAS